MPRFETLMPIRTKGSGPALFCVHGQPLRMAQRLKKDRPLYGLSHVYHSDFLAETPESIEGLARTYLAEVRQVQPVGPYYFCGFSAGGMIAYEMAKQLLEAGESVGNMTLVEPTVGYQKRSLSGWVAGSTVSSGNTLTALLTLLKKLPKAIWTRSKYWYRKFKTAVYFKLGKPLPEDLRWLGYLKSLGPAMNKYSYEPINCGATILYGSTEDDYAQAIADYWDEMLAEGVQLEIFADVHEHVDFMIDPALTRTVELIERTHTH